jgi:hypothetical protein
MLAFLAERASVMAAGRAAWCRFPVALVIIVFPRRLPIAHRHVHRMPGLPWDNIGEITQSRHG